MVFVADDLGAWLIGFLADAGRRRLRTVLQGSDQERALRQAATAAVQEAASELFPDDGERAAELAMVVAEVFREPLPPASPAGHGTLIEALEAGVRGQLAVLDDASVTGVGCSSADVLGIGATGLAEVLASQLVRQIVSRGARGGQLSSLAEQLNNDRIYLQGLRVGNEVEQLSDRLWELVRRLGDGTVAAAPTALAQLPIAAAAFTGRQGELASISGLLAPASATSPPLVCLVTGLAGVGKTALALEAGQEAQRRGWFGGGVLFIDLHGYDEAPVRPAQALDALLRALGVPGEHIPLGVEERAALYRSILAERHDPVLVVVDNVSSEAQVRPLLPGVGPHRIVVTSRHILADLDAHLVDVTVLDEHLGTVLLDTALRVARPDDERIASSPDAAAELARACGGLPLALQITAALLKADPVLSAGELAEELGVEHERLELLEYDDGSGPAASSVASAFELSYQRLDKTAARMFRLFSVCPGPDVCAPAAAVLCDLSDRRARRVLAALARAHLVEAAPADAGRWQMHDLLHLYAQRLSDEHAQADDREQARDRLVGYYMTKAEAADAHLRTRQGMSLPDAFSGRDDALAWLDAERPSLIAAVAMASETGRDDAAMRLPILLGEYFLRRRRFDDWLTTMATSLAAARHAGDRRREADALNSQGLAWCEVRQFEQAIAAHQAARAIREESGDRPGEADALNNLGAALQGLRRFEEAIAAHETAIVIYREIHDRHREAIALNNLGAALQGLRRFEESEAAHRSAAELYRETGDRHREATALTNLGNALTEVRQFDPAAGAHKDAAAIFRETGDQHGEATSLNNLGIALLGARLYKEAIAAHDSAVAIYQQTGDRHGQGTALGNLGIALRHERRIQEAVTAHRNAAAIFRETGDRYSEGIALGNLGNALRDGGQFEDAITAHKENLAICREAGDKHREGIALTNLGNALHDGLRFDEAASAHQGAVTIFQASGDRHSEAEALQNLGTVLQDTGRLKDAAEALRRSASLFRATDDSLGERTALEDLDAIEAGGLPGADD